MSQRIDIINASTVLKDEQIELVIPALQEQVSWDFAPAWGRDAQLSFVPSGTPPSMVGGNWQLIVCDDSDQAGALGYHDLTKDGLPLGKVFAKTDLQYGEKWSTTASHEFLEMLGDPDINLTAFVEGSDGNSGVLYAYEVCDACETVE